MWLSPHRWLRRLCIRCRNHDGLCTTLRHDPLRISACQAVVASVFTWRTSLFTLAVPASPSSSSSYYYYYYHYYREPPTWASCHEKFVKLTWRWVKNSATYLYLFLSCPCLYLDFALPLLLPFLLFSPPELKRHLSEVVCETCSTSTTFTPSLHRPLLSLDAQNK